MDDINSYTLSDPEQKLFRKLKKLRSTESKKRGGIAPYRIVGDPVLKRLARHRPADIQHFKNINGVNRKQCKDFGKMFTLEITTFCKSSTLDMNVGIVIASKKGKIK
eukprot:TRINITY_DN4986_c0_g1_i1.p2 TRINITY_DN4986_c0_g1~~TRINITY_DN4986_c0_g1_i1.p2  ORF type:complete len:107 (-),score=23.71 TRINITY_DN4986_c0_g1_i1:94-414(-)